MEGSVVLRLDKTVLKTCVQQKNIVKSGISMATMIGYLELENHVGKNVLKCFLHKHEEKGRSLV